MYHLWARVEMGRTGKDFLGPDHKLKLVVAFLKQNVGFLVLALLESYFHSFVIGKNWNLP